jgi:hypothetical protein
MCYEVRFFRLWEKRNAPRREEIKPEVESTRPKVQPIRPAVEPETTRRGEREREPETIL